MCLKVYCVYIGNVTTKNGQFQSNSGSNITANILVQDSGSRQTRNYCWAMKVGIPQVCVLTCSFANSFHMWEKTVWKSIILYDGQNTQLVEVTTGLCPKDSRALPWVLSAEEQFHWESPRRIHPRCFQEAWFDSRPFGIKAFIVQWYFTPFLISSLHFISINGVVERGEAW